MVEVTEELRKQCLSDRNPEDHLHGFVRWVAEQREITDTQYETLQYIFALIPYRRKSFIVYQDRLYPAKREETTYQLTQKGVYSVNPKPQFELKHSLKRKG